MFFVRERARPVASARSVLYVREHRRRRDREAIGRKTHGVHVAEPQLTTSPLYADRPSGQIYPDARTMVNAYLARFGQRSGIAPEPLDAGGYTPVRRGSASVGVNVLEDHGVLLFVAPILTVSDLVPQAAREGLYRRLLELSFLTTSDAAFALDEHKNEVVVRSLRRLSGLDYEEFEDLLDTVARVADDWDDTLRAEYGTHGG
jgi:Tir chaperone protein (CesT) family